MLRKVFCLIAILVILPTFTANAAVELSSFSLFTTNSVRVSQCPDVNSGNIGVKYAGPGPWRDSESEVTIGMNLYVADDDIGVVLPPDPGVAGKETLLGIDSDGDGVRDDIQRYIYFTYPDDEKLRLGLTYYAREFQGVLADADDREAAYEHAIKMSRHNECLFYLKDEESFVISDALLAEILNTRERSIAYNTYSDNLGGKTFKGAPMREWKDSCAFDVDASGGDQ